MKRTGIFLLVLCLSLAAQAQTRARDVFASQSPQTATGPSAAAKAHITSVPAGAEIAIDGAFVGNTPSDVGLAPGTHQVKISLGGKEWSRSVVVTAGDVNIKADLEMPKSEPGLFEATTPQSGNPAGDTSSPPPGMTSMPVAAVSAPAIDDTKIMLASYGRTRLYVNYRVYKGEPALVFPMSIRTGAFTAFFGELYVTATQIAFDGTQNTGHGQLSFNSPRPEITYTGRDGHKNFHLKVRGEVKDCYGGYVRIMWTTESDWFKLLDSALRDFDAAVNQFKQYAPQQGGGAADARAKKARAFSK